MELTCNKCGSSSKSSIFSYSQSHPDNMEINGICVKNEARASATIGMSLDSWRNPNRSQLKESLCQTIFREGKYIRLNNKEDLERATQETV